MPLNIRKSRNNMQIKRGGIFKNIDPKEFGIWQKAGFEKVINEPLQKLEEKKAEPIVEDEPIREVIQDEPIEPIVDEMPKPKRNRRNK